ncbi:ABC-2 type transport system ATP-binding protein [Bogoriella caseilytica]|uniref:ABC-2 type transport system ATP-binding protein n=2 Tax=Bogoriella caseilytica TaxID=56055 RepID=A0A3N2BF19_9MICO|nr:ABC-2 type transport system ATP-binding protein [Bogoriella caseilytica]
MTGFTALRLWEDLPTPMVGEASFLGVMCPETRTVRLVTMIEIDSLTKRYGAFTAVDDVSMTCQPGKVTGFLGPNGAGKTTTMRIMAGLTPPTRGSATIGGRRFSDIPNPGRHVGVLLDASAQHGGRTGREILTLGAKQMGLPASRVDEMLEVVSLSPQEAKRRLRHYSLGMRQRLGIAHALLGDPEVLILDEPANGLDPAGIRWMRTLLKSYADRGGTVLLSSHLLHEVEQIADEIILIGHGKIVAQGTKQELLAGVDQALSLVSSLDDVALIAAANAAGYAFERAGQGLRISAAPADVGRLALEARVVLTDLRSGSAGLEDLFLELTSETQRETPHTATEGGAR